MNRNKKNKNIKINKSIENMGNSNSIDDLNTVSGITYKNTTHKKNNNS